ncbi:hypothetical protein ACSSUR_16420 [Pseudomonas cedrina]|uniref:hypothetical protein n=1 Tax=Pseudomonas cedrina TaxID=651740 RepID=UPI003ED9A33F
MTTPVQFKAAIKSVARIIQSGPVLGPHQIADLTFKRGGNACNVLSRGIAHHDSQKLDAIGLL